MSTFGRRYPISLFGESHQRAVGFTIHHLPAGIPIDWDAVRQAMKRRMPKTTNATSRREVDAPVVLSGFHQGTTTGAPLSVMVENHDLKSEDYDALPFRPGHADYPAHIKHGGANDPRGGGHHSGRLTAPLVALGEIARQALNDPSIVVGSHIVSIHQTDGESLAHPPDKETLNSLYHSDFPVINSGDAQRFTAVIDAAKADHDSVGGVVETWISGLPVGVGSPFFHGLDGLLAQLIFSIPAVKGLTFGDGFNLTRLRGSQANDPMTHDHHGVRFTKNDMGGVLGGLSSGQPVRFRTAFKPTPSIGKPQQTITQDHHPTTLALTGRHDTCVVSRAVHVVNAMVYIALLELLERNEESL